MTGTSPTRAERRAQEQRRSRTWLVVGAAVLVVVLLVPAVLILAGGGDDDSDRGGGEGSRPVADTDVSLEAGEVTAESAGPPVSVPPEVTDGAIDLIGRYIETATVEPLRTGRPAGDLSGVFDVNALARATGADRSLLLDEGLPRVTGDLDVVAEPVAVTGLGDQAGNLVLVTATVDLDISGATAAEGGPLHIKRLGSFVMSPDASGTWKVSAYRLVVERSGGGLAAASTTTAGAGQ